MKFAIVNEQKREAEHGLAGFCPGCGVQLIPKCGDIRISHWAHKGQRICDPWWENETEWHRAWKGHFPVDWQEVVHFAECGEKHIADVKTDQGWVLEFQHSRISPEERLSRDEFYKRIVWVVDGTRRKRDQQQFFKTLNEGTQVVPNVPVRRVFPDFCVLLQEWSTSNAPVFFDFGEPARVWWLLPRTADGRRDYVAAFSRAEFISLHIGGSGNLPAFEAFLSEFSGLVSKYTANRERQMNSLYAHVPSTPLLKTFRPRRLWA